MEDDLDELLDEVEEKFCRNDPARCQTQADSSNTPKHPRENHGKHSNEPEDIDAFLEELLDEEYDASTHVQIAQTPKGSKAVGKSLTQSEEKKCRPVFLGGSSIKYGVGSLVSQRSCDQLRCTSCDFRVLTFEDQEWDGSCDYLFLRNNMPDGERLRARLRRSRGRRAYACQCSWFSAGDLADLSQQPQLRWLTIEGSVNFTSEFKSPRKKRWRRNNNDQAPWFMDTRDAKEDNFDDIIDDWFIESLKTYRDLYVYHLDHPTRVIEWTSEKTICVAGFSSDRNELLELHLPPKLFADQNKGLCAERDFKVVHGGFSDGPVHSLRHIPGTRSVVTNDGRSSSLQVWDIGGDKSDVIRRSSSIEGVADSPGPAAGGRGSRVAAGPPPQPCVLHGSQLGHVRLTQLASGSTCYALEMDSSEPLSSLQFVSPSVFLACGCNGNLYVVDTRSPALPPPAPVPPPLVAAVAAPTDPLRWCMDASAGGSGPEAAGCRVARLSSSAELVVSDLRNPGGPVRRALLDVRPFDGSAPDHLGVSWAPALEDCLAVSGFNGGVQIFSVSTWGPDTREQQVLFQHRGHCVLPSGCCGPVPGGVRTTCHTWHPERPRTLLSAATDGSLHVWDWVDPRPAQG